MSSLPTDLDLGALLAEQAFVRRLARSLVTNADDADDVAQLTWMQALRHPLRQRASARAFLGQVTRHVASNFRRGDARRRRQEQAVATQPEATPVVDAFARESLRQLVVAELAALPEPYRRTLVARFFDDLTPHAIAQRENAPDATVRARTKRGLELLRERLDRRYGGDRSAWCTALVPLTRGGLPAGTGGVMATVSFFGLRQLLAVGVVGLVLGAGFWWLSDDETPAAILAMEPPTATLRVDSVRATTAESPTPARTTLASAPEAAREDGDAHPQNGIRGRLVLEDGRPAKQRKVEVTGLDPTRLFDGDPTQLEDSTPLLSATTHSDDEGRFSLDNLRPRALLLLQAGRGEAASAYIPVAHTPGAKHVVDLGDIVLQARGTLRGRVVDDAGQAVAGADVWAADMPGLVALAINVDRFVPAHGGMLLLPKATAGEDLARFAERTREYLGRELCMQVQAPSPEFDALVLDTPAWFTRLWNALPMARTTTAADGTFTLQDVEPANNMLVVTKAGFDRGFKPSVKVQAGAPRDLGEITLQRGEVCSGKIVDATDRPVARAAVRVAVLPPGGFRGLAFCEAEVRADTQGNFAVPGLRAGRVLVAARSRDDAPWTVAGPFAVDDDIALRLPAPAELTVRVTTPAAAPTVRLTFGPALGELARMGLRQAVAMEGRVVEESHGTWRVRDLAPGSYQLEVSAPGCVTARRLVQVPGEAEVALAPQAPTFDVLVVSTANVPLAGARVRCAPRDAAFARSVLPTSFGLNASDVLATSLGCSDRDGRLRVSGMPCGELNLWADHPDHGAGTARAELPAQTLVLRLPAACTIEGMLLEGGQPASASEWRIAATAGDRDDGIERPYTLAAPAADGSFKITGLDPGAYTVRALPALPPRLSLDALQSLLRERIFTFFLHSDAPRSREVVLAEGELRTIQIDVRVAPPAVQPQAGVVGRVTIDGKGTAGVGVHGNASWWSTTPALATTAADGSYCVTDLAEGSHTLTFRAASGHTLGERTVSVPARGDVALDLDVRTSSLAGQVIAPPDRSLRGARLAGRNAQGRAVFEIPVQDDGAFHAQEVPCGTWSLTVEGPGVTGPDHQAMVTLEPQHAVVDCKITAVAAYQLEVKVETARPNEPCFLELSHLATGSTRLFRANEEGRVAFVGLSGGKYHMSVKSLSLAGDVELSGEAQHKVLLTARGVVRIE